MEFLRDLTAEDEQRMIEQITKEVMDRRLESIVIMFLESMKPMSFIGSQVTMLVAGPFLAIFWSMGLDYVRFFEKPQNVEKLLQSIEAEVKVRDEEAASVKKDIELLIDRFTVQLDFLRGFSLKEDATKGESDRGLIAVQRRKSSGGGYLVVSFREVDSPPKSIADELSANLNEQDVRQALDFSTDMALKMLQTKPDYGKIRGHKASFTSYEWTSREGVGLVESYGLFCDKNKRLFLLNLRTEPLTGQKAEKNQTGDLRSVLGSLRCHWL